MNLRPAASPVAPSIAPRAPVDTGRGTSAAAPRLPSPPGLPADGPPRRASRSLDDANPLRRTASLPPSGQAYTPPVHTAAAGTQTFYHVTSARNEAAIGSSGGLMPIAHQPRPTAHGLDQGRGDAPTDVASVVGQHVQNVRLADQMGLSGPVRDSVLAGGRSEAEAALRQGTNAQNLYLTPRPENIADYLLNPEVATHGAALYRTQLDPQRSGLVPDEQGHSGDYRALGLQVPASRLEVARLDAGQALELGLSDVPQLDRLNWQPVPKPSGGAA